MAAFGFGQEGVPNTTESTIGEEDANDFENDQAAPADPMASSNDSNVSAPGAAIIPDEPQTQLQSGDPETSTLEQEQEKHKKNTNQDHNEDADEKKDSDYDATKGQTKNGWKELESQNDDIRKLVENYRQYKSIQEAKVKSSLKKVSPFGPPHSSLGSFPFIKDDSIVMLVVGETGSGKSTLCNKLCGIYYKQMVSDNGGDSGSDDSDAPSSDEEEEKITIEVEEGQKEIFGSSSGMDSKTQESSWAEGKLFGDEDKRWVILDTPGLNDEDKKASGHREDLKAKLSALHRIDVVLIVFKPPYRMSKSRIEMLRDIVALFGTNESFFNHFAVAVTNCDEHDRFWKDGHKNFKKDFQSKFCKDFFGENENSSKIPKNKNEITIEIVNKIPIYTFSGIQDSKRFKKKEHRRWSHYKQFEEFYKFCVESHKHSLVTGEYHLMKKMETAIERLEKESNLSHDDAMFYLVSEMLAERRRLRDIYEKNTKYLSTIPKSAMDGIGCLGKSLFGAIVTVGDALIDQNNEEKTDTVEKKDDNEKEKTGAKGLAGRAFSWFGSKASSVVSAVGQAGALVASGAGGLAQGLQVTITHENRDESLNNVNAAYKQSHKDTIERILVPSNGKQANVQSLSLLEEMYAKYLDVGNDLFQKKVKEITEMN